jgi:hypothetical protein
MTDSEWQLFRKLGEVALDRFCQRVLAEIGPLVQDASQSHHARYAAIYRLLQQRDLELAKAFDNPSRSTALRQLAWIRSLDLLTEEEFAGFSAATRHTVDIFRR